MKIWIKHYALWYEFMLTLADAIFKETKFELLRKMINQKIECSDW